MSATVALERALIIENKRSSVSTNLPMIAQKSLKRSRTKIGSFGSFDMSDFTKASKQVEQEISFPSIGWSFDESLNPEDQSFEAFPPAKRRCRGMVRSKGSADLSTFGGSSSQRFGSSGSLC